MNYTQALDKLNTGRKKDSKKLANNTYLQKRENSIAIKLHNTDIITFNPDNSFILNTNGWKTVTSKDRINTYLPINFRLIQEKSIWYLCNNGNKYYYEDNMLINSNEEIDKKLLFNGKREKENNKLKNKIKTYCKNYIQAFKNGKVKKPSNGDCFYCAMHTVDDNKPLGEALNSSSHILSHFKEKYYVPSLLMNSIKDYDISPIAKSYIHAIWNNKKIDNDWIEDISLEQIKKSLYRYIKKQFAFAS